MKINEVEALVGITKKNVRFYEQQGLLSPRRNSENGYRDYDGEDIHRLRQIKLLRKLGLPIGEIRQMLAGTHTLGDSMRRHMVSLEREKLNLEQSIALCRELQEAHIPLSGWDEESILARMDEIERNGTCFQNKQKQDVRIRYVAPVIAAVITLALMVGLSVLILWAYRTAPEEVPPLWFLFVILGLLAAVAAGVLLALSQRIREIGQGEIDDAKKY